MGILRLLDMHFNVLQRKQLIKASIDETWDFFSSPINLSKITPKAMNFVITSDLPDKAYEGQIITYKVSPILGIPMKWMTEITNVEAPYRFVDNQLVGPYKVWHHQHYFESVPGGTMMTDIVHYSISPWLLGGIADALFVRKQLENIFNYRYEQIELMFNQKEKTSLSKMTV